MSREKFTLYTSSPERPRSAEELKVLNKIDRLLMYKFIAMKKIAPDDDINPVLAEWINTYGDKVDKIFGDLIKEEPELIEEWTEHADTVTDRILSIVEPQIYPPEPEEGTAEEEGFQLPKAA